MPPTLALKTKEPIILHKGGKPIARLSAVKEPGETRVKVNFETFSEIQIDRQSVFTNNHPDVTIAASISTGTISKLQEQAS